MRNRSLAVGLIAKTNEDYPELAEVEVWGY
jgi:hypothetical protein